MNFFKWSVTTLVFAVSVQSASAWAWEECEYPGYIYRCTESCNSGGTSCVQTDEHCDYDPSEEGPPVHQVLEVTPLSCI